MEPVQVRLTTDLTRYHPRLEAGVEGVTIGQYGIWSRGSDRFVGVSFPGIGTFDVLWASLEIIDETYLAEAARRKAERMEALKSAVNVVRTRGPRGGFRYLSYQFIAADGVRNSVSTANRTEAEELIDFFNQHGIAVREEVGS